MRDKELTIHVHIRPYTGGENYKIKELAKGITVAIKNDDDDVQQWANMNSPNYHVSVYSGGLQKRPYRYFLNELKIFQKFFDSNQNLINKVCSNDVAFIFDFGIFYEIKKYSSQPAEIIKKYNGWYFFRPHNSYVNHSIIFSIKEFKDFLTERNIHYLYDTDSKETFIFFKKLNIKTIEKCFNITMILDQINKVFNAEIEALKKSLFKCHIRQWDLELPSINKLKKTSLFISKHK